MYGLSKCTALYSDWRKSHIISRKSMYRQKQLAQNPTSWRAAPRRSCGISRCTIVSILCTLWQCCTSRAIKAQCLCHRTHNLLYKTRKLLLIMYIISWMYVSRKMIELNKIKNSSFRWHSSSLFKNSHHQKCIEHLTKSNEAKDRRIVYAALLRRVHRQRTHVLWTCTRASAVRRMCQCTSYRDMYMST